MGGSGGDVDYLQHLDRGGGGRGVIIPVQTLFANESRITGAVHGILGKTRDGQLVASPCGSSGAQPLAAATVRAPTGRENETGTPVHRRKQVRKKMYREFCRRRSVVDHSPRA